MTDVKDDPELSAIRSILGALQELDNNQRTSVLEYVFRRLDLALPATQSSPISSLITPQPMGAEVAARYPTRGQDIRSLKDEKRPSSATEMAALVAFYLEHSAPPEESKDSISHSDITKYFKQASFPLPKKPQMTLVHAKNAGYFDQKEHGLYRLNPVGYNLVVHRLPASKGPMHHKPTKRRKK